MKSKQIRYSTLVKLYGPVRHAESVPTEVWLKAHAEGRAMTVYHNDDGDHCTPALALIRHDGFVNTICKAFTEKRVPDGIEEVIGMRNNQDAWDLCQFTP